MGSLSMISVRYFVHCLSCVYVEGILALDDRAVVFVITQLQKPIMKLRTSLEYHKNVESVLHCVIVFIKTKLE